MTRLVSSLVAVALLAAVCSGAVFGLVLPAHQMLSDADQQVQDLQDRLSAFRARTDVAMSEPVISVPEDVLLTGTSNALAAAELQEIVEDAAQTAGVEIDRIRIEDPVPQEDVSKTVLDAGLITTLEPLTEFLHLLENSVPYIVIERIEIRRVRRVNDGEEPEMTADLVVSGFAALDLP